MSLNYNKTKITTNMIPIASFKLNNLKKSICTGFCKVFFTSPKCIFAVKNKYNSMKTIRLSFLFITISLLGYSQSTIRLDQLSLTNATTGWGTVVANKSIGSNSLKIGGITYTNGVGIHSPSEIVINLAGASSRFQAIVGIDDEVSPDNANLEFQVYADNVLMWTSGIMQSTDPIRTKTIDLDITGKKYLSLVTTIGNNGTNWFDHADWVSAVFTYSGTAPICIAKSAIPAPPVINNKTYIIEKGRAAG